MEAFMERNGRGSKYYPLLDGARAMFGVVAFWRLSESRR